MSKLDINNPDFKKIEAAENQRINDALLRLKNYKIHRYLKINLNDPNEIEYAKYLMAQTDLLKQLTSITFGSILTELLDEEIEEPAN